MFGWTAALREYIAHLVETGEALPTVEYGTPPCSFCGRDSVLVVPTVPLARWFAGELIQDAFPDWTRERRELLKTGIHPECWNAMLVEELS